MEHTFRFVKQSLNWTTPRVRLPAPADRWTWIVVVVYTQLRLVLQWHFSKTHNRGVPVQDLHHELPDASLDPLLVAGVNRMPRGAGLWHCPPRHPLPLRHRLLTVGF